MLAVADAALMENEDVATLTHAANEASAQLRIKNQVNTCEAQTLADRGLGQPSTAGGRVKLLVGADAGSLPLVGDSAGVARQGKLVVGGIVPPRCRRITPGWGLNKLIGGSLRAMQSLSNRCA